MANGESFSELFKISDEVIAADIARARNAPESHKAELQSLASTPFKDRDARTKARINHLNICFYAALRDRLPEELSLAGATMACGQIGQEADFLEFTRLNPHFDAHTEDSQIVQPEANIWQTVVASLFERYGMTELAELLEGNRPEFDIQWEIGSRVMRTERDEALLKNLDAGAERRLGEQAYRRVITRVAEIKAMIS